jgi:dTDP-4-dehydrorhamnose reductase
MMNERILITGVSGFIGEKLLKNLQGPNVYGTFWSSEVKGANLFKVNVADEEAIKKLLQEIKPTLIYHLAGMTSPKKNDENPEGARASHINAVSNILKYIDTENCHLIYLSTDKVFDGSEKFPDELSKTVPSCLYGDLKLQCEEMIKARMKKYHTVRLSVVHSNGDKRSTSVIDSSILKIKDHQKVNMYKNVLRCFADVTELIDILQKLKNDTHYGLYHYGSELISYYDRTIEICEKNGIAYKGLIEGTDGQVVPLVQDFDTKKINSLNL